MGWWDFGENSGYDGDKLALWRITCGFCNEEGKFETVQHLEKKNTKGKVLNYDTLKCECCGNLTMVFWSASTPRGGPRGGLHNYETVPWPQQTTMFPEHWPNDVGRYWLQARRSLEVKNWDAAVMARSAIQLVVRYNGAKGATLKQEIDDLAKKGILPPVMKEWSHEVRVLGNENAHPKPGEEGTGQKDAKDVVEFLGFLLKMTYNLQHDIEQFRGRKKS
jgi:hypothetical protein